MTVPTGLIDFLVWLGLQVVFYIISRIRIPGGIGDVIGSTRDRIESDESASREQRTLAYGRLGEAAIYRSGYRVSLGAVLTSLLMFGYYLPGMAPLLFLVRFVVLVGGAVGVIYCYPKIPTGVRGAHEDLVLDTELGSRGQVGTTRSAGGQSAENEGQSAENEEESDEELATEVE